MADISLNGKQRTYFTHMSDAYAQLCSGDATLMTDQPLDKIPQDGIWGQTEFPALKRTGNVGGEVDLVSSLQPAVSPLASLPTHVEPQSKQTSPQH